MPDKDTPTPALEQAFELGLERAAPFLIGTLATGGQRRIIAVNGGYMAGEETFWRVLGGRETLLDRPDGVTVIEVEYEMSASDGLGVRAFGRGYRTADGDFVGTRLTIQFEADERRAGAHLATRVFVGEQKPDESVMHLARVI